MNKVSRYILELYNYMLNIRDTMEFTIQKEHSMQIYENRKKVLVDGIKEGFAFGNFLKNNGEKGDELRVKFDNFIKDYYSEDSVIIKPVGDVLRIDHVQNLKIYQDVVSCLDIMKDIIFQYMGAANKDNQLESIVPQLVLEDDRMYRVVIFMLVMKEYVKSYSEFNKIMGESKGVRTPQSNFIVQNELSVMAKLLRGVRALNKFTDNETLDILDDSIKVIEMTEGRRDRPGNKSFKEIFDEILSRLTETVGKVEASWKKVYGDAVKQIVADQQQPAIESENNKA